MKHEISNNVMAPVADAKPVLVCVMPTAYNRPPLWRASLPGREPIEFYSWDAGISGALEAEAMGLFAV